MDKLTNNLLVEAKRTGTFIEMSAEKRKTLYMPEYEELYEKLNRYERIEEDSGCPLDVALKALKDGFFDGSNYWYNTEFILEYDIFKDGYVFRSITKGGGLGRTRFKLSDHQKTWWLKEEYENGRYNNRRTNG